MELRRASRGDVNNLAALGAATFASAFGHLYKPEDMAYFIAESHSQAAYQSAIDKPDEPIWVVEVDMELVAYIKLCPNSLPCDPPLPDAIEISKIYALPAYQGRKLGSRLLNAAIVYARAEGASDMVLSVFSENYDGHRFYARHGFEKIGEYDFPVGQQLDKEWIMRKTL